MKPVIHHAVYGTFADWETGHATAHLRSERFHREPGGYAVVTVGPSTDPVVSMGGLRVTPDLALDRLTPEGSGLLILPGADLWDSGDELAPFARKAREFLDAWFRLFGRSDASAFEVLMAA
ncbi:hypothetical protein E1267_21345 [Nonomuraea longispora]|uniref:DJ-1/PfpI domain-containing protein n=1 Tax=Nonomuraea longispora TaxID=1848320 RepID=A0A4R4N7L9_9ACTN|nr:DJ-1/PfpI family protein [Nonomuraea longispora]TDC04869.1 hypothetical protein E1267_21345 [Nonomuraea longispora]